MIDWLGDRGDHYSDAIRQCSFSHEICAKHKGAFLIASTISQG